jgi:uncharacterized protein
MLYTAFIIGLVGSLHCIGMCGPIALMLPVNSDERSKYFTGRFLYNLGRIITYSFMGLIIGFIGSKLMFYGMQQILSILLGAAILLFIFTPRKYRLKLYSINFLNKLITSLKNSIGSLFSKRSLNSLFIIGLLNGFLPCGLVYVGLGTSAVSGSAFSGAAVMFLFGLGTLPVMFAVSSFGKMLSQNFRNKAAKIVPVFAVLLAIIFILRGLNLGIPFISPKMQQETGVVECHK